MENISNSKNKKTVSPHKLNLMNAKKIKEDEFYTLLEDIKTELNNYEDFFKGKVVFCNCDDPYESNFFKYFAMNFNRLGLKKLISTCYASSSIVMTQLSLFENENIDFVKGRDAFKVEVDHVEDYNGDGVINIDDVEILLKKPGIVKKLKGDGDFRSDECVELLKKSDVVCTNPPFSNYLPTELIKLCIKYNKKFLLICNPNMIAYRDFFPLIKNNQVWLGYKSMSTDMLFRVSKDLEEVLRKTKKEGSGWRIVDGEFRARTQAVWFTNIDISKRHEIYALNTMEQNLKIINSKKNAKPTYQKYTNFDGIDVNDIKRIPSDYSGAMGVPISFLEKYNPEQFEILGLGSGNLAKEVGIKKNYRGRTDLAYKIDGIDACAYARMVIRKKEEK